MKCYLVFLMKCYLVMMNCRLPSRRSARSRASSTTTASARTCRLCSTKLALLLSSFRNAHKTFFFVHAFPLRCRRRGALYHLLLGCREHTKTRKLKNDMKWASRVAFVQTHHDWLQVPSRAPQSHSIVSMSAGFRYEPYRDGVPHARAMNNRVGIRGVRH